jgi:hypothetical protein
VCEREKEGLITECKYVAMLEKQNKDQNRNSHDQQEDAGTRKTTLKT